MHWSEMQGELQCMVMLWSCCLRMLEISRCCVSSKGAYLHKQRVNCAPAVCAGRHCQKMKAYILKLMQLRPTLKIMHGCLRCVL